MWPEQGWTRREGDTGLVEIDDVPLHPDLQPLGDALLAAGFVLQRVVHASDAALQTRATLEEYYLEPDASWLREHGRRPFHVFARDDTWVTVGHGLRDQPLAVAATIDVHGRLFETLNRLRVPRMKRYARWMARRLGDPPVHHAPEDGRLQQRAASPQTVLAIHENRLRGLGETLDATPERWMRMQAFAREHQRLREAAHPDLQAAAAEAGNRWIEGFFRGWRRRWFSGRGS